MKNTILTVLLIQSAILCANPVVQESTYPQEDVLEICKLQSLSKYTRANLYSEIIFDAIALHLNQIRLGCFPCDKAEEDIFNHFTDKRALRIVKDARKLFCESENQEKWFEEKRDLWEGRLQDRLGEEVYNYLMGL